MIHTTEIYLWGSRIGIASFNDEDAAALFEYDSLFQKSGIELSPICMPLSNRVYSFPSLNRETFRGLPGLLADSLPDTFGNAVIDSWLASKKRTPDSFTSIERLCYMGKRGMGALEYIPANGPISNENDVIDIDEMAQLASMVLTNRQHLIVKDKEMAFASLLKFGTSAGGARAKAIIAWNPNSGEIRSGQIAKQEGFDYWIVKFDEVDGNGDHGEVDSKGYTRVEYAYYLMAKEAGININECRLYEDNNKYHFMTRRFDRDENTGDKIHMQTLGSLAHLDYKTPRCCSYEKAAQICRSIHLGTDEIEELYRQMVFNVLSLNCDDHVKNFSFLMNRDGGWHLAPAYDLCFSYRPDSIWVSKHQMTINGKANSFYKNDLLQCAETMSINHLKAERIINEVNSSVEKWMYFAKEAKVKEQQCNEIEELLVEVRKSL